MQSRKITVLAALLLMASTSLVPAHAQGLLGGLLGGGDGDDSAGVNVGGIVSVGGDGDFEDFAGVDQDGVECALGDFFDADEAAARVE